MPKEDMAADEERGVLLKAARRLGLPVVASEQYKKGWATPSRAAGAARGRSGREARVLLRRLEAGRREILVTGRKQVIVAGMEAHVCVFQTVRDLARGGFAVFVPQDAIVSRTEENGRWIASVREGRATLTSTETVLFDLLEWRHAGVQGTGALIR